MYKYKSIYISQDEGQKSEKPILIERMEQLF